MNGRAALAGLAAAVAVVAGGACDRSGDDRTPGNTVATSPKAAAQQSIAPTATDRRVPEDSFAPASESRAPAGQLPPPSAPLRFVGRWAAEEPLCAKAAWEFTARSLRTPAGSFCGFESVERAAGGYDIHATCTAEAPPRADLIKLRFAESARAMLFEADSIADVGLVYCGPVAGP